MGRIALLLALAIAAPGCATVAHGRNQMVSFTSEPPGAEVFIGQQHVGVTPTAVKLPRRKGHLVARFEKPGFAAQDIPLTRKPSGWVALDVAVAFEPLPQQGFDSTRKWVAGAFETLAIFAGIDALTGAAAKFPNVIRATLRPVP